MDSISVHLDHYSSEYQQFMVDLESESLSSAENEILADARKTPHSIQALFDLHLHKLKRIAKNLDSVHVNAAFFKRIERLDRLTEKTHSKMFKRISKFVISFVFALEEKTEKNDVFSANPSEFLIHPNSRKKIALFKPINSAPSPCAGVENDFVVQRQVGAYLLARHQGGIDVPLSFFVSKESEIGSFQTFRKNDGDLTTLSAKDRFDLPLNTLHRATIFRGRLYDLDAHLGNVLWRRKNEAVHLTHIDLDYTFPVIHNGDTGGNMERVQMRLGWSYFPQLDEPFQKEVVDELKGTDIKEESQILGDLPVEFPEESLNLLKATTMTFQIGAELGLTPGNIIDFLSLETFKSHYRDYSDGDLRSLLSDIKTKTAKTNDEMKKACKNLESAKLFIKEQLFSIDFIFIRYAVKLIRETILSKKLSPEQISPLIAPFQEYVKIDINRLTSAVESFADAFEVSGKNEAAQKLRVWIQEQSF